MLLPEDMRAPSWRSSEASSLSMEPRICVVFATRGRPALLARTLAALQRQTSQPTTIIVACSSEGDVAGLRPQPGLLILKGRPGLAAQRNNALRHVPDDADYIVFFDDDFLPRADWIETVVRTFADHPDVGSITGNLIADGIKGPGLSFEEAEDLIAGAPLRAPDWIEDSYVPYGCNMAFRRRAIAGRFFDERLVLYGWLEDRDFGRRLEQSGSRIVRIGAALGVHMGAKAGRVRGRQLGYSQVVNPIYLHRKGTMQLTAVSDHIFRNVSSNLARSLVPERHIDRLGRLLGNLRGFVDLMRGRLEPERAADL